MNEATRIDRSEPVPGDDADIVGLQAAMSRGTLSSVALTAAYLRRIDALNQRGPELRAVIETNPQALETARTLDAERAAGSVRGALHGLPILIKDNIATRDRMLTTAGSLALVDAIPGADAPIVTRLREAGAVILGKTNMSEWANFRSTSSLSGWSGRGGLARNPHVLDRSASGSSSGSAIAVAAQLCVAAIGTETNGSIVSPSSVCGVVGFKPTVGWASRTGIIPIAASLDTAGPMARSVRDAAIVFGVLAGLDPTDPATHEVPANARAALEQEIARGGSLNGARIGVLNGPLAGHALMPTVRAALLACGAELVEDVELDNVEKMLAASRTVCNYEFKAGVNAYLAALPEPSGTKTRHSPVRTLADVIAFNEAHADREMPMFGQELLLIAQATAGLHDGIYLAALETARRLSRAQGIDALMNTHRLDAIVSLTAAPAPVNDWVNGTRALFSCSTPAAVAGYPHLTLPAGQLHGLPMGVSLFGRAWSDVGILGYGAELEARLQARRDPTYLASLPLRNLSTS